MVHNKDVDPWIHGSAAKAAAGAAPSADPRILDPYLYYEMAPPRRLRRQNPKIGEDCEFQRTDIFRHFIRLAGRFSEIWQRIKKISKNRSYTLKILEFHVESPEGN